jgi:type 1 glutamine amidotransferase
MRSRRRLLVGLAGLPILRAGWPRPGWAAAPRVSAGRVLLVTATAGYYHDSIPTARRVVQDLAARSGELTVTTIADSPGLAALDPPALAEHDVLCFANTSGELPLGEDQKRAILDFVAGGKGFVGTHSATDTCYDWPGYGELVGAYFQSHPWVQPATVLVEDAGHPSTRGLGASFAIAEEFYTFRANPRPDVRVLLRLDASSVGADGDYPLAWWKPYGAGRVYYNALGHFAETWEDPRFHAQLLGALRWAAGLDSTAGG